MTLLVLVCGMTGAAVLYIVDAAGLWEAVQMEPWVYTVETSYVGLVAVHFAVLLLCVGSLRRLTSKRHCHE